MTAKKRPGPFLTILVVGVMLGALGTCGGIWGVVGQLLQGPMLEAQRDLLTQTSQNDAQLRAQLEMQDRIQAAIEPYKPALITHQVFNVIASIVLMVSAILMLQWKRSGLALWGPAVVGNIVVDLGGGIMQTLVQQKTSDALQAAMIDMARAPGSPPGMEQTMEAMARASMGVGMCVGLGIVAVKLGFYAWSVFYVRKDATRDLFPEG